MNPFSVTATSDDFLGETMHMAFEASRVLHHAMTQKFKGENLNLMQLHVLYYIREHEGVTMKELAQYLKITSPSATTFVARLVRNKWVRRTRNKVNRKLIHLYLTDIGREVVAEKLANKQQLMRSIFLGLSPKDQLDLHRIMHHLLVSYEER